MKKREKSKYPKWPNTLRSGFGETSFKCFQKTCGFNKNIAVQKLIKKNCVSAEFNSFIHGHIIKINKETDFKKKMITNNKLSLNIQIKTMSALKKLRNYRGIRHLTKLPTRGQRTKTNAKTVSKKLQNKRKKKVF